MARKEKNIHYIYKTTCNVTGKWYVGMHSTHNLEDGYMGSGTILRRSIRKHGVENHTKEILEYCETKELLVLREIEIVTKELISDGLCMNLKEGGWGGFCNEEHMIKCHLGSSKWVTEKWKDENYIKESSERASKRMIEHHKNGKINYNTREGQTHTEETKKLMSEKMKEHGHGETNSQFGTVWIIKDNVAKKIKKEELDTYLSEDWKRGRK